MWKTQLSTHSHTHTLSLLYSVKHLATVLPGCSTTAWLLIIFAKLLFCSWLVQNTPKPDSAHPKQPFLWPFNQQQRGSDVVLLRCHYPVFHPPEKQLYFRTHPQQYPSLTSCFVSDSCQVIFFSVLVAVTADEDRLFVDIEKYSTSSTDVTGPINVSQKWKMLPGEPQLCTLDLEVRPEELHDTAAGILHFRA